MTDLALDETFNVFLDDRNDVGIVDGQAKFEQNVAVFLTEYMHHIPGDGDLQTIKEKIRLQVSRVARNHDLLDSIQRIVIERDSERPSIITVELVYNSSATFDFDLNL